MTIPFHSILHILFSFVDVSCFFKKLTSLACAVSFLVPLMNKRIVQNSLSKSSKYLSITAKYLSLNLEWNFSSNSTRFAFSSSSYFRVTEGSHIHTSQPYYNRLFLYSPSGMHRLSSLSHR